MMRPGWNSYGALLRHEMWAPMQHVIPYIQIIYSIGERDMYGQGYGKHLQRELKRGIQWTTGHPCAH